MGLRIVDEPAEGRADLFRADAGANRRDGVGLSLGALRDAHLRAETADGLLGRAPVVESPVVGPEDEHLVAVEPPDQVGGDTPVEGTVPGYGIHVEAHRPFLLGTDPLLVGRLGAGEVEGVLLRRPPLAGAAFLPECLDGLRLGLLELDHVRDGQADGHPLDVVVRPHVREGPALVLEVLHQCPDRGQVVFVRIVFITVRDDGHDDGMVLVSPELLLQAGQGLPHRIVQGGGRTRDIGLGGQDRDRLRIRVPVHELHGAAVEEDERDVLLLGVRVFPRGGLHSPEHFVEALDGRAPDVPHGSAAVHDDHVVDLGLAAAFFRFHASLSVCSPVPDWPSRSVGIIKGVILTQI